MDLTYEAENAHKEGRQAYLDGVAIDTCPYPEGSTGSLVWHWAWLTEWDGEHGTE